MVSERDRNRTPILGCVADDVTGATDLSLNLVQGGMQVVQWLGIPGPDELRGIDADADVIALKSRSIAATKAVELSVRAMEALRGLGCRRFYFKYCSTFDSTDEGNIGPVAEALMNNAHCEQAIFCPSFPEVGRTVYLGHLLVHDCLLHESGMQHHPLNPMRDPCLVRVLARQARHGVGLLPYRDVAAGPDAIAKKLKTLLEQDRRLVIADALDEHHLRNIAEASVDSRLITGGSGLARFLPQAYRARGILRSEPFTPRLPEIAGRSAILSGSCSQATLAQVARQRDHSPAWALDVKALIEQPDAVFAEIMDWVSRQGAAKPLMVYSTAPKESVLSFQEQFGSDRVAVAIELLLARVAKALVENFGVRRLVVAGGETSSAVAAALGVRGLCIGPEIAPGVPWTESFGVSPLALAFKSGNFGGDDFFQAALEMLG